MKIALCVAGIVAATLVMAEPLRVALLDFENQASASSDASVIGGVTPKTVAEKGVYAISKALANSQDFVLIDQREFIKQLQEVHLNAGEKTVAARPTFLRAAQALNADVVLRGSLVSYSPGKQVINQGGYKTEFTTLALRVALQALDTMDGTVIAAVDGAAKQEFRQTDALQTVIGEDELVGLLQSAVDKAIPDLNKALQARVAQERSRPMIKLSVKTGADPALIEIDGLLIGTTPLKDFKVYEGDHVITVGKAGFQDVNKKILLKADTSIEVPLLRTQLSADEIKEVLEKSRMNVVLGVPQSALIIDSRETVVPAGGSQ